MLDLVLVALVPASRPCCAQTRSQRRFAPGHFAPAPVPTARIRPFVSPPFEMSPALSSRFQPHAPSPSARPQNVGIRACHASRSNAPELTACTHTRSATSRDPNTLRSRTQTRSRSTRPCDASTRLTSNGSTASPPGSTPSAWARSAWPSATTARTSTRSSSPVSPCSTALFRSLTVRGGRGGRQKEQGKEVKAAGWNVRFDGPRQEAQEQDIHSAAMRARADATLVRRQSPRRSSRSTRSLPPRLVASTSAPRRSSTSPSRSRRS